MLQTPESIHQIVNDRSDQLRREAARGRFSPRRHHPARRLRTVLGLLTRA